MMYTMSQHEFLTLFERLSQVYLNQFTMAALLLLVKVYLLKTSINSSLSDLRDNIDCKNKSEEISDLINRMVENSLGHVKVNYGTMLGTIITTIKSLILFYIEMFLGTFTCLLNATIRGTTSFAFDSTQKVILAVNDTITDIAGDIQEGLDGLSFVINHLISTFNAIRSLFGSEPDSGNRYKDKINISIRGLRNIAIPSSVLTDIDRFRQKDVPFEDLQNSTQVMVAAPFDLFSRKLLESSLNSSSPVFSNTTLPVLKSVDPLCQNSVKIVAKYHKIIRDIDLAAKYVMIALGCVAALVLVLCIWREYRQWRRDLRLCRELQKIPDNLTAFHNVLNRHDNTSVYLLYRFNICKSSYILWLVTYLTSSYAQTVLLIGLLGLLSALLLFLLIRLLASTDMDIDFDSFKTASDLYITETNRYISTQQDSLNAELFGNIRTVSQALNTTIVGFMDNMNSTLDRIFGNTPFEGPINTVVYCTIGRKLEKIELALTWIHSSLKIELPLMDNATLDDIVRLTMDNSEKVHSAMASSFAKLVAIYNNALWVEFLVSLCFISAWVLQLVVGLLLVWARIWVQKNENQGPIDIGEPKPLTSAEKHAYGYPVSTPIHDRFGVYDLRQKRETLSSVYEHL